MMEFCLFYEGELPSNGDKRDKHKIRTCLAPQLKVLWNQEPLNGLWNKKQNDATSRNPLEKEIGGYTFIPLVTSELHLHAEISIDLLRPGRPGDLVHGGDIDNRLKTLFDALRMPNDVNEIVSQSGQIPYPLYCLLADDRLITRIDVVSHQLLNTVAEEHVVLLMKVNMKASQTTWDNIGL